MIAAGTNQLTSDGNSKAKNSKKVTLPFCHTISVVMSPKGVKAPPAFAATTTLMQARATNAGDFAPTARTTEPMTSAVVRLSSTPDRKKDSRPVSQNNCL
jgi:hypothetical protein